MQPDRRPKPPDENDRLRNGTLPAHPALDVEDYRPPGGVPIDDEPPFPSDDDYAAPPGARIRPAPPPPVQLDPHIASRDMEERRIAREALKFHYTAEPDHPVLHQIDDALLVLASKRQKNASFFGGLRDEFTHPSFIQKAAAFIDQPRLREWIRAMSVNGFKREPEMIIEAVEKERKRTAKAKADAEAVSDPWPVTRKGPYPIVEAMFAKNRYNEIKPVFVNAKKILDHDPRWKGRIRMNRMGNLEVGGEKQEETFTGELAEWISDNYGVQFSPKEVGEAIRCVAYSNTYSPVEDYLNGLEPWDGVPRFGQLLTEVLGCEPNGLYETYLRRMMTSAVARALQPGCKVDTVLILQGKQGAMKSTFFEVLCSTPWFGASAIQIENKDAPINLRATWMYEAAEMASLNKRTADDVKHFLSLTEDLYRAPYGTAATRHPRHFIMVASTNQDEILSDPTGSRRFWPMNVPGDIDLSLLRLLRDQLWAEALVLYRRVVEAKARGQQPDPSCRWWFAADDEALREADAAKFEEKDVWDEIVEMWARDRPPFSSRAVLEHAINMAPQNMKQPETQRVNKILRRLGYDDKGPRDGRGGTRLWRRRAPTAPTDFGMHQPPVGAQ